MAGPKRPQDRFALKNSKNEFLKALTEMQSGRPEPRVKPPVPVSIPNPAAPQSTAGAFDDEPKTMPHFRLNHGAVAIAAITSCTNTSNPAVMIAAGLVAKKAVDKGLRRSAWVKTSLAPGSKVVTDYLTAAGLTKPLDALGFNLVGYGCTTCIGNSGPLPKPIADAVTAADLVVCAVLSGNRNFEGRINPNVRASYLASPPLVVVYAIAGRMDIDLGTEALGMDLQGRKVYFKDIWPTQAEISAAMNKAVQSKMFAKEYSEVFEGDEFWKKLPAPQGKLYAWDKTSTYIKAPPFFDGITAKPQALRPISGMRALAWLGDSVTTDHISPAGNIGGKSSAGDYLNRLGVKAEEFNSYGARRGNYEVMVRGTFANIRLRNLLVPGSEGPITKHPDSAEPISIFDASARYHEKNIPLLIIAGKEYGSGSSRDWAAKGPCLQGVKVVLAESYERIHRSNLIGMGILPLQFMPGDTPIKLGLTGNETFSLEGLSDDIKPGQQLTMKAVNSDKKEKRFQVIMRINTPQEIAYYKHGGILHYVLRSLSQQTDFK
jgi:aconitate hydratase